ncbi:tRNA (carboxymethyluridine(34)-5-O)-methyltransferase [Penicillium chermesinum]|uniref:tRNA (Carboxymethyluridine(34)-5-O)-methyltransferase n=1 Tax=Penicillium chermesinum TaxID=63820 RepID=A0A9W9NBF8_9EURO|nr:tRNA (carboxymethyluridine(34)-5-O)-methyltransferase [Penicillium chermesinum]KAJ5216772.1 tRNA (carboxymethyluridine(34)-5-O)-methyltransferase [Penicillium chermesinum]KAJ6171609.1 tRNA (carboxymethyluridine(34)-5-O)-methyltransferase [Penicillium chermesinum]
MESQAEAYEQENVHEVYQNIAQHFSATRYKPWPIVHQFLQNLTSGSIGLDVGCGNGKNLMANRNVFIIGSDRSENLARIALKQHPHSAIVADILRLPHRDAEFDFAICIAVVHHLSTPERRAQAIAEILRTVKRGSDLQPGGQVLIYAWALEQKDSRRGWAKGDQQDVMVPWVRKNPTAPQESQTFHRYYHLYEEGELEGDVERAGGQVVTSGYEKDNWWVIATPKVIS